MDDVGYYYTEPDSLEWILSRKEAFYPWHLHAGHWTLGQVGNGSVVLATSAAVRRFGAGRSFIIRPYESHSLRVEPDSSLLVVCFDEQSAPMLETEPERLLQALPFVQGDEGTLCSKNLAACKTFFETSRRSTGRCGMPLRHVPPFEKPATPSAPGVGDDSPLVRSIHALMHKMLKEPDDILHLDQMATLAGYSPWHFLRAFQKVAGMTPHAFQVLCRIRLSRAMLRADAATCAVAVSAGFADQSHLHKAFKRHHGLTPKEFKKSSVKLAL